MVFSAAVRTLIWSCLDGRPLGAAGAAGLVLVLVPGIWRLVIRVCIGVPAGARPAAARPAAAPALADGSKAIGTAASSSGANRLANELRMTCPP
jgi:hypothetical protein